MEDIKSIEETIKAIKALVDVAAEVMEDGKVDVKDIAKLPEIFSKTKSLIDALKDVKAEAEDLDAKELREVLIAALDLVLYVAEKFGLVVK